MSPLLEDPRMWMAHEPGLRALARRLLGDLPPLRRLGPGRVTSGLLVPGNYLLWIDGSHVAFQELPFSVRANEETRVSSTIAPGHRATIVLLDPPDTTASTAHLTVTDATGATVLDQQLRRDGGRPIQQWLGLGPGRYTVSLEAEGRRGTRVLVVATKPDGPIRLEITLDP